MTEHIESTPAPRPIADLNVLAPVPRYIKVRETSHAAPDVYDLEYDDWLELTTVTERTSEMKTDREVIAEYARLVRKHMATVDEKVLGKMRLREIAALVTILKTPTQPVPTTEKPQTTTDAPSS